nr:hypothetical protein [Halomonas hydrothermalis]
MNEEKQLRIIQHKVKLEKENAVLLQQLHDTQEAYETLYTERKSLSNQLLTACTKSKQKLEKSTHDQLRLHQQLEKRQKELNILRADTQRHISHLESLVQWLRVHAQRHAAVAYRDSRSYKKELPKQLAMLEATPFFDADWYLAQYPDVAKSGIKPAEHFIKFGAIDGRHPSSQFSTDFYLTHYKDVAASGQHPLLHYLRHGIAEQRKTQPPQHHLPAPKKPTEGADA